MLQHHTDLRVAERTVTRQSGARVFGPVRRPSGSRRSASVVVAASSSPVVQTGVQHNVSLVANSKGKQRNVKCSATATDGEAGLSVGVNWHLISPLCASQTWLRCVCSASNRHFAAVRGNSKLVGFTDRSHWRGSIQENSVR